MRTLLASGYRALVSAPEAASSNWTPPTSSFYLALRPLPRAMNTVVNLGIGIGGLLLVSLGVAKVGQAKAA